MKDALKERIAKIYELIKRGASEGEREAARKALNRIMEKYDLEGLDIDQAVKKEYIFKYTTIMEIRLLERIILCFLDEFNYRQGSYYNHKITIPLDYLDYVTVDSAYQYFRRHMKSQWNKTCLPIVNKCRKTKTRNKKRAKLSPAIGHPAQALTK